MAGGIPDHMLSIAQNLHSVSESQNIYLHKTERERYAPAEGKAPSIDWLRRQPLCARSGRYLNFRYLMISLSVFLLSGIMEKSTLKIRQDNNMSLLEKLSDEKQWKKFYEYKTNLCSNKRADKILNDYIDQKRYLPVCARINEGIPFPLPQKAVINKTNSSKKRIIYMYPEDENTLLKLLTYLMLRKYDYLFSDNLYSFRPGKTAKDAVRKLVKSKNICNMYCYKADISNYFNSIYTDLFLPLLKRTISDDQQLYNFLEPLLTEPEVIDCGKKCQEKKGIMAGTPLSAFYANLFLNELDHYFSDREIPYARYSDDIIVFAESQEKINEYASIIRSFLTGSGLAVNKDKEFLSLPGEERTFLGSLFDGRVIDIAPVTVKKLKKKMYRKTRALFRWSRKNNLSGEKAASAFIRIFNSKLFDKPETHELSWSFWFFSVINTDRSLRIIDKYAQDCLRYLISGKRTKARFNVRYEHLKKLGYKSLVHEYYSHCKSENK